MITYIKNIFKKKPIKEKKTVVPPLPSLSEYQHGEIMYYWLSMGATRRLSLVMARASITDIKSLLNNWDTKKLLALPGLGTGKYHELISLLEGNHYVIPRTWVLKRTCKYCGHTPTLYTPHKKGAE